VTEYKSGFKGSRPGEEFNFKSGRILSLFVFRRQQLRIIKLPRKKDLIPALLISEDYLCDNFLMLKKIYKKKWT